MTIRVMTMFGTELDARLQLDRAGHEVKVAAQAKLNPLANNDPGELADWVITAIVNDNGVTRRQACVLGSHVEAVFHKMRKQLLEQTRLFNAHAALLGSGD